MDGQVDIQIRRRKWMDLDIQGDQEEDMDGQVDIQIRKRKWMDRLIYRVIMKRTWMDRYIYRSGRGHGYM